MKLRIVHLYPSELGINGDVGNVTVLTRRAEAHGHEVDVIEVGVGGELPADADIVHIGSGPFTAVQTVLPDALRHASQLRALRDSDAPILAIGGGWELLGRRIVHDGGELAGLDVLPSETTREARHSVGETVLDALGGVLTGFANHSVRTTLLDGARPLGSVRRGFGNDGSSGKDAGDEGVVVGASIGTHLHGCVLGMNPRLADQLIAAALARRDADAVLGEPPADLALVDEWASRSRAALRARVGDPR